MKRTRPLTGQEAATKRQQEAAKIAEYQRVSQPLLELVWCFYHQSNFLYRLTGKTQQNRKGDYAPQHLELSARLVDLNAEMPTAWAFRRRVLLNHDQSSALAQHLSKKKKNPVRLTDLLRRELPNVLKDDLKFTLNALRRNPKTYAVWEHRKWVLQHFPEPERTTLYRHELALVDGFLKADARNCESSIFCSSLTSD